MRSLDLSPPDGPIRPKYLDVVHNDDFAEIGFVGPFATAKSTALVDRLVRRAVEYPGSNILIARATLTSLKESTIDKLRRRVGAIFAHANNQEALFTLPEMEHPVTRLPVASEVKGIGLDRNDLERVLKSTEYSTVGLEEANEIGTDAHDMVQERSRQEIFHYKLVVRDMCMKLAIRWSKVAGRTMTPEEVYRILLDEPRNDIGKNQYPINHPMPGETVVASVWNPVGSDATWMRYVGVEHPQGRPTAQWVKDNVGIREKHVDPKKLREDTFFFRADRQAARRRADVRREARRQEGHDGRRLGLPRGGCRPDRAALLHLRLQLGEREPRLPERREHLPHGERGPAQAAHARRGQRPDGPGLPELHRRQRERRRPQPP